MKVKSKKAKVKISLISASLCLSGSLFVYAFEASPQWIKQTVNTTASFRGLSVVSEKVVWASGTGGTVIRTIDGGKTWKVMIVPGAEKLDFRDIEAFDANTAYILSIGNGESSRIYKTTNAGRTWKLQFKNDDPKKFFDAITCVGRFECYAVSDPVQGIFPLLQTFDGGNHWYEASGSYMVKASLNEAAFAASGTCLIREGQNLFFVTGGSAAKVYKLQILSGDHGIDSPPGVSAPIVSGNPGSGIFSISMFDAKKGVIVGGNYEKPDEAKDNLAFTSDGGRTWQLGTGLSGYRSAVTYIDEKTIIAVGTNGTDVSSDSGKTWKKIGSEDLNAVAAKGKNAVWAVGPKGMVAKLK
ncbi:MAG: glycosyl hydrolase [Acidobacteria bacterium]|nr:MAG: glycosyl hydrolase [Acidobacteriota bacterium]